MTKEEIKSKIEKLKKKKEELEILAGIQDTFQHSYKIYLNSVYGFTGTQYSPVFSTDLAEAVTSTGRMTIQEMVRFTNNLLLKIDNGGTGLTDYVVAGDTDSCDANTNITILTTNTYLTVVTVNSESKTIEKLFNDNVKNGIIEKLTNGTEVITPFNKLITKSLNGYTKIKNISRHKVSKDKWKITVDNKKVEITSDHSVMIYRDGQIIECRAEDIKDTDYLIIERTKNENEKV